MEQSEIPMTSKSDKQLDCILENNSILLFD